MRFELGVFIFISYRKFLRFCFVKVVVFFVMEFVICRLKSRNFIYGCYLGREKIILKVFLVAYRVR